MALSAKDQSFSLDENENVSGARALAQSTPRKKQGPESCDPQDVNATDDDLNVSNISLAQLQTSMASTVANTTAPVKFKKPHVPKPKRKPKFTCTYCLKGYICERSFKNHIMQHTIQDAQHRYPNKEIILRNIIDIAEAAFKETSAAISFGTSGAKYKEYVEMLQQNVSEPEWKQFCCLLADSLLDCAMGEKFFLPSKLLSLLLKQVEKVLSNKDLCMQLNDILVDLFPLTHYVNNEMDKFLLEFTLNFSQQILKFISKTIRVQYNSQQLTPKPLDDEDMEVVYYIGGSIIRGYLRIASRHPNNPTWKSIMTAIRGKILVEKPDTLPAARWTMSVDRGGLLYISEACQQFFISVTEVIFKCEKKDGSIDFKEVLQVVSSTDVSIMWDNIIYDALPERLSISLMNNVVKCMCQTCGRGFAKKRLNVLRNRPVVSMPTRHLVASRKK